MQYFQKLIQKDLGFSYTLDTPVSSHERADIWSLHHGASKDNAEPALVFHYDISKPGRDTQQKRTLSKQGLMRLKTLRHPDILKYLSSVEGSDGTIYVATERATPLSTILSSQPKLDRESIQWGLFTIARALGFLHDSGLIHARVNSSAVYLTPTGDWKLGGLECVTAHPQASSLSMYASLQYDAYKSPEIARGNWSAVSSCPPSAVDSWALGCLMYEAHAGSLNAPEQLQNISVFPKPLLSAYQKLLASNPANRAPAGQLLNHPYFQNSKFVELNMFVENIALKGQLEREAFLSKLPNIMDRLPDGFCTYKVLPMLSQSIISGTAGSAAFACIVKMNSRMTEQDFGSIVVNKYATQWYASPTVDRSIKVELYNQLQLFVSYFDDNTLNTTIFPAMCSAFQDMQAPALRDASVKSVLSIADKLTDKNRNSTLMSHFARLQVDPEPAIRTNTTVCLGKLAPKLSQNARNKVLVAAFLRSLKDPFPHARAAGLNAILNSAEYYNVKDIATRLLPAIVPLLIDPSGDVRSLAFKAVGQFQKNLSANHKDMSRAEESAGVTDSMNGGKSTAQKSAVSSSSSGWGLSSFSSMTAALLSSKGEAAKGSSTSTGISSEDFKKGASVYAKKETPIPNGKPAVKVASAGDVWGSSNGGAQTNTPAAFASTPLQANSVSVQKNSFNDMGSFGGDAAFGDDNNNDDGDDGWGDMDIKSETKPLDDEDLFASMMGQAPSKPKAPAGMSKNVSNTSGSNTQSSGDLWDLAPPLVSKPKPPSRPRSGAGLGGTATGRRAKKSGGDDWEALLGGSGSTSRRKPAGRTGR